MEKRNVETWYCKRDDPVTRVGGRNPGLRHRAPRWRCDVYRQRRAPRSSSKRRLRITERLRCILLRAALGLLRPGVRESYGRRWPVASLPMRHEGVLQADGRHFVSDNRSPIWHRNGARVAKNARIDWCFLHSASGDPGMTRTCDLRLRKLSLYP